ncbi:MAG: VirB3 family type IV secretion system protein [Planctomycetota bacterium]
MSDDTSLPDGYEVPLHTALTQPLLFGGVPRTFGILNVVLAMLLTLGLKVWWLGLPMGFALHTLGVWFTKRDPDWFDVFRTHLRQPTHLDS